MDLSELEELIAYEVADKAIPSISYVLFDRDGVLAQRHVSQSGNLLGDATRFRIGSISKTFAALLAIRLVEQGRLSLDGSVADLLPGFKRSLTLRKLLSHRSGLTREATVGHYLDCGSPPLSETVASLREARFKGAADGSTYFYSNAGYAIVGRLVEIAAGRSYAQELGSAILEPLGLNSTAITLSPAIRAALAAAKIWDLYGDGDAPLFDLGGAPAGNIYSTLGDVARYGQMLLREGEGIVRAETLRRMWRPAGPDPATGYGLGFAVSTLDGRPQIGHGGVVYGYASSLQLLPEAGLGLAMFSTLDFTSDLIGRLSRRALRLALADRGMGARPKPSRRLPRARLEEAQALAGIYAAGDAGPHIEIVSAGSRLTLIDEGVPIEIRPIGQRRYVPDGRISGEETSPALALQVRGNSLDWRGREWRRVGDDFRQPIPGELMQFLGLYAPDFAPTQLYVSGGVLMCLIEYFCPHWCEPLGGNRFLMHGGLYEQEVLELGVAAANGSPAIKVGEMTLPRIGKRWSQSPTN